MNCDQKDIEEGKCRFLIENGKEPMCKRRGEFLCRESLIDNLPKLSHSARELWVKCRRAWYIYKVRGIQAKPGKVNSALRMGSMWDKFQENLYGANHDLTELANKLNMSELEVARFNAIATVFKKLHLEERDSGKFEYQKRIILQRDGVEIIGYVDRAYEDHFTEIKMSARPQYYQEPFNIAFQVGTYFLANPNWQYVTLEVARTPTMTLGDLSIEEYEDKLTKEISKKGAMYFPGLNRKEHKFGKVFYRAEFPLEAIAKTYAQINKEITEAVNAKGLEHFYQSFNCSQPYPCDFLPICKDGVISNTLFQMRDKGEETDG
jgi:hypothetical protein